MVLRYLPLCIEFVIQCLKEAVFQPADSGAEDLAPLSKGKQSEQFVVWMRGVLDDVASLFQRCAFWLCLQWRGAEH